MRRPQLRFRHKMLLPPAVAVLALLATLLFTRWLAAEQRDTLAAIEQRHLPTAELSRELETLLSTMQRQLQDAAAAEDADGLAAALETRNAFAARIGEARERALLPTGEAERLDEALRAYHALARATTARLIAKASGDEVTEGLTEMSERYNALRDRLAAGTAASREAMSAAFAEAGAIQTRSSRLVLLVLILGAAAAAGLALAVVTVTDRALASLTAAAKRVASDGDLSQAIEVGSKDELGELAEAFGRMMERLRTLLGALKVASEDLSGAAGILDASTENQTQLLQQQASFLTEVSATTKELEQTSSLATQQAEAVLGIAHDAGEYSRSGEASASESLARVQEIQQQIRNIVTRSAQLGEQARQVGDIVESVKEIASQSQILSLNASIEAARAGEAGRGFAVVAHEVRALAEQSGQSAGRIGKIVQDIARAVGATVEMTEQGNRTMEAGIERIRASGESLKELGSFIGTTSEAALQIAGAVKQQSAGVAQIATAISDLDARMQEAVRGIQAVRQAAGRLTATSSSIRAVVGEFRA